MLGIPDRSRGCLFDLDGVLTQTATVHAAAWQQMFDDFLRQRAERTGGRFDPFDPGADYVDRKPRADGTRSFLQARGIDLPEDLHAAGNAGADVVVRDLAELLDAR